MTAELPRRRLRATTDEGREDLTTESSFQELGLGRERLQAIAAMGWEAPTPIQVQAIPAALGGRDLVGIAQTGTGKTGAFLLPSAERMTAGGGLQLLVLCPARELAQQVAEEAALLTQESRLRVGVVVGGTAYGPQLTALRSGYEIVTATPGRLNDHLRRGTVDLSKLRVLVLDEADRMLDMGFRVQIEDVVRRSPTRRQSMLFSATMPNGVHALALQITKDPLWLEATPEGTTAEGIRELVYTVKPASKPDLFLRLLEQPEWDQVLAFARTKAGADALCRLLERADVATDAMHSDRQMRHRVRALDRFASRSIRVLVATDLAQRGLDVEGISHVVNYDIPLDPDDYVHRIGRTGRAGASGTAVTFVTGGELGYLRSIEHRLGRRIERVSLPEYDYGGSSVDTAEFARVHRSRAGRGFGSRSAHELTDEELKSLLDTSR